VVALLVPRVGEVDPDLVEAGVGDLIGQHFDRIVVVDPYVAGVVGGQRVEQATDAGGVDLDADQVAVCVVLPGEAQRLAVAEADLEHARRAAAEHGVEIARLAGVVDAEARPLLVERALLGRAEAALAQHEAADLAMALGDRERLGRRLARFAGIGHGFWVPLPLAGEGWGEGAAKPRVPIPSSSRTALIRRSAPPLRLTGSASPLTRSARPPATMRWRSACAGCVRP